VDRVIAAWAALAALAVGYLLGRWRPAHRASDWAHWLNYQTPRVTRRDYRWWLAQPVYVAEIAWMFLLRPRETAHAWRHRNDPPPKRGPVLVFDTDLTRSRTEES
jgi:hypothetical protein